MKGGFSHCAMRVHSTAKLKLEAANDVPRLSETSFHTGGRMETDLQCSGV